MGEQFFCPEDILMIVLPQSVVSFNWKTGMFKNCLFDFFVSLMLNSMQTCCNGLPLLSLYLIQSAVLTHPLLHSRRYPLSLSCFIDNHTSGFHLSLSFFLSHSLGLKSRFMALTLSYIFAFSLPLAISVFNVLKISFPLSVSDSSSV